MEIEMDFIFAVLLSLTIFLILFFINQKLEIDIDRYAELSLMAKKNPSIDEKLKDILNNVGKVNFAEYDSLCRLEKKLEKEKAINAILNETRRECQKIPTVRDNGWYWVKKEEFGNSYSDWQPAEWRQQSKSWRSTSFSGIPDTEVIAGNKIIFSDFS